MIGHCVLYLLSPSFSPCSLSLTVDIISKFFFLIFFMYRHCHLPTNTHHSYLFFSIKIRNTISSQPLISAKFVMSVLDDFMINTGKGDAVSFTTCPDTSCPMPYNTHTHTHTYTHPNIPNNLSAFQLEFCALGLRLNAMCNTCQKLHSAGRYSLYNNMMVGWCWHHFLIWCFPKTICSTQTEHLLHSSQTTEWRYVHNAQFPPPYVQISLHTAHIKISKYSLHTGEGLKKQ